MSEPGETAASEIGAGELAGAGQSAALPPGPLAVVAVGGSAGSLDSYERFFSAMPNGSGLAFVVVPHLGKDSLMPELLARCTTLPVQTIQDGQSAEAEGVYVLPPGHTLQIMHGQLLLSPSAHPHRPIDAFLESLAADQGVRAVGVILSGMGGDGSAGVQAIRARGGRVYVQDPDTALAPSMPQSAVASGAAHRVLPPEDLAAELYADVTDTRALQTEETFESGTPASAALQKILLQVRSRSGQDFARYKPSTLVRRIDRRMKSQQIADLNHYARLLQESPAEADALFRDFLINVTSFFRDPHAFEELAAHLRGHLREHPDLSVFRAWVVGCSTGEEAYSLAMLLCELTGELPEGRPVQIQIFATDLDPHAIDVARVGLYPAQIAQSVSPERLERFFVPRDNGYQVRSELREKIVFACHNVASDPPFTRLDLLSCRNVLIYFGPELQKSLLPLFHYALKPGGLLLLGPSETIGSSRELFTALSNRWKLYRRSGTPPGGHPRPLGPLAPPPSLLSAPRPEAGTAAPGKPEQSVRAAVQRLLLSDHAPPAVVVDARGSVVYVSGHTAPYLELPGGVPSVNVLELARPALRYELSAALRAAVAGQASERVKEQATGQVASDEEVARQGLTLEIGRELHLVDLSVRPLRLPRAGSPLFMIVFLDRGPVPLVEADPASPGASENADRVTALERALKDARLHLQATIEEMEVSLEERKSTNEELQSSNEELQTTNEELQSSNEELMTSKEELQSLNEELITINSEHQLMITDLQQANDDMKNLLDSVGIATLFVDNDLRVRRFTSKITQVINLMPVDVGRPLTDITPNLRYAELPSDIRRVLDTLTPFETAVQTTGGEWFLMRVSPYRTFDNFIDGVVVVFTNIGPLKLLEQQLRQARLYSEAILDTLSDPVVVLDHSLRVVSHNRALPTLLGLPKQDLSGERLYDLGSGPFDQPELTERLRDLGLGGAELRDFLLEMTLPGQGPRAVKLNARPLRGDDDTELILLWGEDLTPVLRRVAASGADAIHDPAPEG